MAERSPWDPGIFFLCPDEQEPTGGIASIYRQVEILDAAGYHARVLHTAPGFRCHWFESDAPVASAAFRSLTQRDLIVIPEVYGPQLHEIAPLTPFAIFNQSLSLVFNEWPLTESTAPSPFDSQRLLGIVCVSDVSLEYVRWLFPQVRSARIRHGIEPLATTKLADRAPLAAFMPRRNETHAREVINAVRTRSGDACRFEALAGVTHDAVIERLLESRLFLSFGGPEGFGLPVLEAMNAGCLVVGYHGYGGRELLTEETGIPIDFGDLPAFARALTSVLEQLEDNPSGLQAIADRGTAYARAHYGRDAQVASALDAWGSIIAMHPMAEGLHPGAERQATGPEPGTVVHDVRGQELAALHERVIELERSLWESREREHEAREQLRRITESGVWKATGPLRSARRRALGLEQPRPSTGDDD